MQGGDLSHRRQGVKQLKRRSFLSTAAFFVCPFSKYMCCANHLHFEVQHCLLWSICRENDRPHRHVPVHRSAGSHPEDRPARPARLPDGAAAPRKPGYRLRGLRISHAAGSSQFHHPAGAVLPVLRLRHRADGQDGARHLLHLHRFQDVDHGGRRTNRPSPVSLLSLFTAYAQSEAFDTPAC